MDSKKSTLIQKIKAEEARLADIDAERRVRASQLAELRKELSSLIVPGSSDEVLTDGVESPRSNEDKIALFRSLFRGRLDVFPKFSRNQKKQTKGYVPACGNEWVQGVCENPG